MRKRRDLRPDCIEIAFAAAVVVAIAPQRRILDFGFWLTALVYGQSKI
jgi:hypothetical protein